MGGNLTTVFNEEVSSIGVMGQVFSSRWGQTGPHKFGHVLLGLNLERLHWNTTKKASMNTCCRLLENPHYSTRNSGKEQSMCIVAVCYVFSMYACALASYPGPYTRALRAVRDKGLDLVFTHAPN